MTTLPSTMRPAVRTTVRSAPRWASQPTRAPASDEPDDVAERREAVAAGVAGEPRHPGHAGHHVEADAEQPAHGAERGTGEQRGEGAEGQRDRGERQRDGELGEQADEGGAAEDEDGVTDETARDDVGEDTLAGEGDSSHGSNLAKRRPRGIPTSHVDHVTRPRAHDQGGSRSTASRLAAARSTATAWAASWSPCSRHHCWPASGRV